MKFKPSEDTWLIAIKAAIEAGKAVMEVYNTNFNIQTKADGSPITLADQRANQIICDALGQTGIGIISEESANEEYPKRKDKTLMWLVDPVDGTKEFTHRNGEFSINIALIENQQPVFGIVTAPALNQGWFGWLNKGAWKIEALDQFERMLPSANLTDIMQYSTEISSAAPPETPVLAVSRSHLTENTIAMMHQIFGEENNYDMQRKGSSLKFCMIAEGKAHFYLRADSINEWDTAAGHAVLLAAGGGVMTWPGAKELRYNKEKLIIEGFVAFPKSTDLNWFKGKLPL